VQTTVDGAQVEAVNIGPDPGKDDWLSAIVPSNVVVVPVNTPTATNADGTTPTNAPTDEKTAPQVILPDENTAVPDGAVQADVQLTVPFNTFVEQSTLTAQLFSRLPVELANALGVSEDRISIQQVRGSDGGSVVTVSLVSADGTTESANADLDRLNVLLQDPNSILFTDPNSAFSRLLDPNFNIKSSNQVSGSGAKKENAGDQGSNTSTIIIAVVLSGVLYVGLTSAFIYTYRRNQREKMAAQGLRAPKEAVPRYPGNNGWSASDAPRPLEAGGGGRF
jgi:hypothetical protein